MLRRCTFPSSPKAPATTAGLRDFATKFDIPLPNTCFFGDDVNDLSAMKIAGLCACPADAAAEVHAFVSTCGFVCTQRGDPRRGPRVRRCDPYGPGPQRSRGLSTSSARLDLPLTLTMTSAAEVRSPSRTGRLRTHFPGGQFLRYLCVGAFNTLFGYCTFAGRPLPAQPTLRYPQRFLYLTVILASILSTPLNITVAYVGYKFFVFRTHGNYLREWLKCFAVYGSAIGPQPISSCPRSRACCRAFSTAMRHRYTRRSPWPKPISTDTLLRSCNMSQPVKRWPDTLPAPLSSVSRRSTASSAIRRSRSASPQRVHNRVPPSTAAHAAR